MIEYALADQETGGPEIGPELAERGLADITGENQGLDTFRAQPFDRAARRAEAKRRVRHGREVGLRRMTVKDDGEHGASDFQAMLGETYRQGAAARDDAELRRHHPVRVDRWTAMNRPG